MKQTEIKILRVTLQNYAKRYSIAGTCIQQDKIDKRAGAFTELATRGEAQEVHEYWKRYYLFYKRTENGELTSEQLFEKIKDWDATYDIEETRR